MAVEMGAKNGIIAPDETTRKFLEDRVKEMIDFKTSQSDKDAVYEKTVEFDV
jgi:3-isopropylmalate/(R)-2-methylmalate dehydratase large subunit